MNKVILMGRLTKDPEIRYTQSAEPLAIARYSLAVNKKFKRDGEQDADFIECVTFGKSAEFVERFLKKGMMIAVSGRLQNNSWDDATTGQKRYKMEVIVEEHDFAESKAAFESRRQSTSEFGYESQVSSSPKPPSNGGGGFSAIAEDVDNDDLPF